MVIVHGILLYFQYPIKFCIVVSVFKLNFTLKNYFNNFHSFLINEEINYHKKIYFNSNYWFLKIMCHFVIWENLYSFNFYTKLCFVIFGSLLPHCGFFPASDKNIQSADLDWGCRKKQSISLEVSSGEIFMSIWGVYMGFDLHVNNIEYYTEYCKYTAHLLVS